LIKLREGCTAWREVEDETVVLHLDSSTYLGVNAAGTLLWRAMTRGATRSDLVEQLVSTFGIEGDRAAADVDAFIDDCRRRGLLEN
jgi:hypothetical protein